MRSIKEKWTGQLSKLNDPIIFSRSTAVSDSSTVDKIDFDPNTHTMMVTYNTGVQYVYSPVTPTVYGSLVSADSVGKMLNILVKENDDITYVKVD